VLEREGEGWRLAWNDQRHPFPLLIGGETWATELTAAEGEALLQAIGVLCAQHLALVETLMEEETIGLDFTGAVPSATGRDSGELCVFLEGDRRAWTLRFVLHPSAGQRGVEGAWGLGAAQAFARASADVAEAMAAGSGCHRA